MLANLLDADAGRVLIADHDLQRLAEAVTGRADHLRRLSRPDLRRHDRRQPVLRAQASAGAARPSSRARWSSAHKRERHEAERSGNSPYDSAADWIDYAAARASRARGHRRARRCAR